MKIKIMFALLFMLSGIIVQGKDWQQKFDKAAFYKTMSSGTLDDINNEIEVVTSSANGAKDGYEGALLIKKAGLVGRPAEKLKLFKAGRIKLETALLADMDNTELHYLRFAIQEHAPKIVKYRANLEADKLIIQKNYKKLSPAMQQVVMDYTKNSKLLKAQDLTNE